MTDEIVSGVGFILVVLVLIVESMLSRYEERHRRRDQSGFPL